MNDTETQRIYTRCPACGNDTLIVNNGHLLCMWHACPDPTRIDRCQPDVSKGAKENAVGDAERVLAGLFYGQSNLTLDASKTKANQVVAVMREFGWSPTGDSRAGTPPCGLSERHRQAVVLAIQAFRKIAAGEKVEIFKAITSEGFSTYLWDAESVADALGQILEGDK